VVIPTFIVRRFGEEAYRRRIAKGLTAAWNDAEPRSVELSELRAVAFSDHHRGKGDGADDFRRCEAAYRAALGWYLEQEPDFELWLLGDVEELWENRPRSVLAHYDDVLDLERGFGERLRRFYGNHDMAWSRPRNVRKFLGDHVPPGTDVREALRIELTDSGKPLGTLFLVHGHQGTVDSGNLLVLPISRFVVRVFWATLQRSRGFANTSPATDNLLRSKHDRAMASWADAHHQRIVMVAGHTHHPVFPGTTPPDLQVEAERAENAYRSALTGGGDASSARSKLELARSRAHRDERYEPPDLTHPCYFNCGCCSFGDGDVTALEFRDGDVRLTRWLADDGGASLQPLEGPLPLTSVFGLVTGDVPDR
jgi:UDP-2,3-diacylglucosamine pyrophosphatase LpxH